MKNQFHDAREHWWYNVLELILMLLHFPSSHLVIWKKSCGKTDVLGNHYKGKFFVEMTHVGKQSLSWCLAQISEHFDQDDSSSVWQGLPSLVHAISFPKKLLIKHPYFLYVFHSKGPFRTLRYCIIYLILSSTAKTWFVSLDSMSLDFLLEALNTDWPFHETLNPNGLNH